MSVLIDYVQTETALWNFKVDADNRSHRSSWLCASAPGFVGLGVPSRFSNRHGVLTLSCTGHPGPIIGVVKSGPRIPAVRLNSVHVVILIVVLQGEVLSSDNIAFNLQVVPLVRASTADRTLLRRSVTFYFVGCPPSLPHKSVVKSKDDLIGLRMLFA